MRIKNTVFSILLVIFVSIPLLINAQVLGLCGSINENTPNSASPAMAAENAASGCRVLRPGDKAINFELTAVVGNEIKNVKLSDYNGKWRIVCFYPADFTFV